MKQKISEYMDINRIEFVITDECSGKCKHCQSGDEINKKSIYKHVITDYAVDAVEKLASFFTVTSVMTFGGEPLLYADVVSKIHKKATDCRIETRQIITNGYFTNDAQKSKIVVQELFDAGINNLLISVDGLHQESIPIEPVYQFVTDVIAAKIPGAYLLPAWVVSDTYKNPYNDKTKEILKLFSDLPIPVKKNIIDLTGNAAKFLAEYYDTEPLCISDARLSEPCSGPLDVKTICIEPNGDVWSCGGVIGNIYSCDIIEIIKHYDPYKNKCMSAIMNGGFNELLDLAHKQGVMFDISKYYNVCWDACNALCKRISAEFI